MIARTTGETRWLEMASELAGTVLSLPAAIPWYTSMARAALALAAVDQADVAAAREQYAALSPLPGIMLHYISTDRLLGLLACTLGNVDQAAAHFEDSLSFCRRANYLPELAWSCHDYAGVLMHRNGAGDRQQALSLLDEAQGITRRLSMQPLAQRLAERREQLARSDGGALPSSRAPVGHPDGLSQREVQVLQLVARGKSNSDIAEELFLSVRTVERHISNIYSKIKARGRADATSYALSHGLALKPQGQDQQPE